MALSIHPKAFSFPFMFQLSGFAQKVALLVISGFLDCALHPTPCLSYMDSEGCRKRESAKLILLQKLKNLKIKSEETPLVDMPVLCPPPPPVPKDMILKQPQPAPLPAPPELKTTSLELANRIYEGAPSDAERVLSEVDQKVSQHNLLKPTNQSSRPKRPYYEHYSKEGVFEPMLDYVRNHPNPSGKPPNIPESMYAGIEVVAKRPWVYFGPQNVPPSDCQQINQKNFSVIFSQVKNEKKLSSGLLKKSGIKKKGLKRNDDDISEISDQYTSNFTFSDSVDLSKESDLISEFRSQTKTLKHYDSINASESQAEDDYSSVSGSVTQRHRYNLFDSSESEEDDESNKQQHKKTKYKKIMDHSDSEASEVQNGSSIPSVPGSSGTVPPTVSNEEKGSSVKVEVDENESEMSESKSKSKSIPKGKKKAAKRKGSSKSKKNKMILESDSD